MNFKNSLIGILLMSISGLTANISPANAGALLAETATKDNSNKDTWVPIGYDNNRIAVSWIRVKTYEELNENSFRFQAQTKADNGKTYEGRIDVNCKNKDWYWRPNGFMAQTAPWAVIPKGSGIETVAKVYCKRSAAAKEWGYTQENKYLWNIEPPTVKPENAKGNWVLVYDNDEAESYFNDAILGSKDAKMFAFFIRSKKGERSAAAPSDNAQYFWVNASCSENSGSVFVQLDKSVVGEWIAPEPGRPGGALMVVKQKYCK